MKKTLVKMTIFVFSILFALKVDAASFNMTSSTKSVKPNSTFTVSVGGEAIGRVNLSVSNGTLSQSSVWVEQNYQSITVTAGASGTVTVTATPVTGFSDADANIYNPGSRSVTVTIANNTSTVNPPATDKRSSNNDLSSLNIEGYDLSPEFTSNVTKYSLNLTKDIKSIKLTAYPKDSKAKVDGVGEKTLKEGLNSFAIVVTAENGSKKTYTVDVYVEETPTIILGYKGEKIGLVKNVTNIDLAGFKKENIELQEDKATIFKKDEVSFVYGIDESGIKSFYLFDTSSKEIINKVTPITIHEKDYFAVDAEPDEKLEKTKITINDKEIEVYKTSSEDYFITYLLSGNTPKSYLYETTEGTIQLFDSSIYENSCNYKIGGLNGIVVIVESALLVVLAISLYAMYRKLKEGKKR